MTETTAKGLNVEPLTTVPTSRPQDNIFRSFNILNPNVFNNLLGNLRKVTAGDISEHITVTDDSNKFERKFLEHSSSRESKQELSTSIGISGKYGVFSASTNFKNERVEASSFTALFATYRAQLNMGTVSLNGMTNAAKRKLLHPAMAKGLKNISSLADAEDFTKTWGTHLVTRVRTGGMIFISLSEETSSNSSRKTVATEVKTKFDKVVSLETAISVTNDISRSEKTKNVAQDMVVLGGDNKKAAMIKPTDDATVREWLQSVTADTTFAVDDSIEIFRLATGEAQKFLKRYLELKMLEFSIEHPTIFVNGDAIRASQACSVVTRAPKGFKIIGGGAATTTFTGQNNNYLMGTYPQTTGGKAPAAWLALSHDWVASSAPGDVLTGYAIAIHDPENYLEVIVAQATGGNTRTGRDVASARLQPGITMTCGGAYSRTLSGHNKFITASFFANAQTWAAANIDYKWPATNAELHAYAVGIRSKDPDLIIEVDMQAGSDVHNQVGHPTVGAKGFACGGGVLVTLNDSPAHLVQACWPSTPEDWKATNTFLDRTGSRARSQAYVLSLHARINMEHPDIDDGEDLSDDVD